MDLQSLYPASLTPSFLTAIKDSHIANYNDLFFVSPPIYFNLFVWLECLIHLPVSFWAIRGLLKGMFFVFYFLFLYDESWLVLKDGFGGGRTKERRKEKKLGMLYLCCYMM